MNKRIVFKAIGLLVLLSPAVNWLALYLHFGRVPGSIDEALKIWGYGGVTMMAVSPFLGGMMMFGRRFAWYSAVLFFSGLILVTLPNASTFRDSYNVASLTQACVALAALFFFFTKDVYKPLLSQEARGWRQGKRYEVNMEIDVEGRKFQLGDISDSGLFFRSRQTFCQIDQEVSVKLRLRGQDIEVRAIVARQNDEGTAVRFLNLSASDKASILAFVRNPRRDSRAEMSIDCEFGGHQHTMVNLSASGAYIPGADADVEMGAEKELHFHLNGREIKAVAKVIRKTEQGVGLTFVSLDPGARKLLEELPRQKASLNKAS